MGLSLLGFGNAWIGAVPNMLGVPINLADAVKRNSMDLSFDVNDLKCLRVILRKRYFLQWDQDDAGCDRSSPIENLLSQIQDPTGCDSAIRVLVS